MHYFASATVHYACSADRARVVLNSRDTVLAQHDNLNSRTETAWGGQHLQEGWRAWKVAQVYRSGFIAIVARHFFASLSMRCFVICAVCL